MKVCLTVVKGADRGRQVEFTEPRAFILGRGEEADFRLPLADRYVSRRHIYLEISPPSCGLRNLNSTNPPHVNKELVETYRDLQDGDLIQLGYTQLRISITADVGVRPSKCAKCGGVLNGPRAEDISLCTVCETCPPSPVEIRSDAVQAACHICGTDLSAAANTDGRGRELADVAIYSCDACLAPSDENGGRRVGEYVLRRSLGAGGMGTVYLAYHPGTCRVVALKEINDLRIPQLAKRFEREVHLLKGLEHRNIVRYFDTGTSPRGPYLVTEFVPDGNLEDLITKGGKAVSAQSAIAIGLSVLAGLDHLHGQGVVHRDIKPPNILVRHRRRNQSDAMVPKIADFGLARSYVDAGGARLTKPRVPLGTLMFMPPEQVLDPHGALPTADVYATGVTLYYLLTLRYTFDFPTPADIAAFQLQKPNLRHDPQAALDALMMLRRLRHPFLIILEEQPVPLAARDRTLPRDLTRIIDKATAKDPNDRFASASAFRAALETVA